MQLSEGVRLRLDDLRAGVRERGKRDTKRKTRS